MDDTDRPGRNHKDVMVVVEDRMIDTIPKIEVAVDRMIDTRTIIIVDHRLCHHEAIMVVVDEIMIIVVVADVIEVDPRVGHMAVGVEAEAMIGIDETMVVIVMVDRLLRFDPLITL
jgi:hypothetical protein